MTKRQHMRLGAGFTLIEILIVVAILAILVTVAAPNMRAFMDAQRVKSPASDLYASLVLARSEAITRNASVDLVPNVADWAGGWRVRVQSGGTVLRVQDAYAARLSITSNQAGVLTYGGNGRLVTSAATFRIRVPENPDARMRCVSVDVSGRPNVRTDRDSDQTACN